MDKGVAGHVASTGEILNIQDAYADDRFNRLAHILSFFLFSTFDKRLFHTSCSSSICNDIYMETLMMI